LSNSHGVDNDRKIDENVDGLVDEMSPDARTDDEQYEMYEGDTPVHDPAYMRVDEMCPDTRTEDEHHEVYEGETPVQDLTNMKVVVQREMVVISEARTPSCKSKRRAQSADKHSLDRAKRIKAAHNLGYTSEKGNSSMTQTSFIHFSNENVIGNL
jgi:hypothetical protein